MTVSELAVRYIADLRNESRTWDPDGEVCFPAFAGALQAVLEWLPDTPENRKFIEESMAYGKAIRSNGQSEAGAGEIPNGVVETA